MMKDQMKKHLYKETHYPPLVQACSSTYRAAAAVKALSNQTPQEKD